MKSCSKPIKRRELIKTEIFSVDAPGFWIKNVEIASPADGVTFGSNTLGILKNIEIVANDLDIRSSVISPSFKVVETATGGKK